MDWNIAFAGPGCKDTCRKTFKDGQFAERIGKADGFVLGRAEK